MELRYAVMERHVGYLLTAYVHDELPQHLRARVSRHIQSCDACYAALCREREIERLLLNQARATAGTPPEHLARLLPGILAEAVPARTGRRSGYGLVAVLSLVLLLLMPAATLPRLAANASPQDQPSPQLAMTATQNVTDAPLRLAASPTAVAVRSNQLTEPPPLHPSPVPVLLATLGS
jgi:anti-sigma factor RsiW